MTDLHFGVRMLSRCRGSSVAIVILLALGIGAGTVIFSLFDAVVARPLPVRRPEQLVRLVQRLPRIGTRSNFPTRFYTDLRDHSRSFSAVFGESGNLQRFTLTEPAPAEQISVHAVTPEFFNALGARAYRGRVLTTADARDWPGAPPAVLSYPFWARRFHSDSAFIGRTVQVNGHAFLIVGVMPREFHGISADTTPDLRIPLHAFPMLTGRRTDDSDYYSAMELAARLRDGVTISRAQDECLAMWKAGTVLYFNGDKEQAAWEAGNGLAIDPLERGFSILRDRFGDIVQWLMGSALLLALLVCANVAGLLAARAAARHHEIAVRLAVGATRMRLVRQMLAENSLLAALGSAGGLTIAFVATPLLTRALPPVRELDSNLVPITLDTALNGRVLMFSIGLSLLAMLFFTVLPAVAACRAGLDTVLRGARSTRSTRGRQALITVQIALCTFLLCGAGLQVRAFHKLHDQRPGFDIERVATFSADVTGRGDKAEAALLDALKDRVRRLPGVTSVAVSVRGVLRERGLANTVAPAGKLATRADFLNSNMLNVSPEYFDTMGIRLVEGRDLTIDDAPGTPPAHPIRVVVNQSFARRFFPAADPIGQRFGIGMDKVVSADYEIVGVCTDAKYRSMREPLKPISYVAARTFGSFVLNVRTQAPPESLLEPVQKILASIDPSIAFTEVHTLAQEVDASTSAERLAAALASSFAALAALLAAVGLYGLLAFTVAQRSREIGIRMALGAGAADVAGMLWRQTMVMAATGIVAGLAGIWFVGPAIRSVLYEISPHDPQSLILAAISVTVIALASSMLPAWRAVAIEPAAVLHE
jgi:predicted permease